MTLAVDFLRLFTEGWAQYLADASIGLTWHPTDQYDPATVGIWLAAFPADPTFDASTAVVLTPYPLADDATLANSTVGLQIKSRAPGRDPRAVWALDDKIANRLLGNFPLTLPTGVRIETLTRTSSTSLGQDDKNRWTWSSSYPCQAHRPGAFRL